MASIIKLKRSSTASAVPGDSTLQAGELAINLADKKLFSARSNGETITISGDQYNLDTSAGNSSQGVVTLTVDNNALSNDTIVFVGDNGTVVSQTNSSHITVDSTTYAVSTGGNSSIGQITLTPTGGGDASADTLSIKGANGIVVSGNSTQITVTAESFDYDLSAGGSATTGTVVLGDAAGDDADADTVTFSGANNVVVKNVDGSNIEVYLQNNVTTATVTTTGLANVNSLDVVGNATVGGTLDVTSTSQFDGAVTVGNSTANAVISASGDINTDGTLDVAGNTSLQGANTDVGGHLDVTGSARVGVNLTVAGNLTVEGTTTTVESTTVTIDDPMLSLGDNNTSGDVVDIGFYGTYNDGATKHFAIVRDATTDTIVAVNGIGTEPGTTVTYNAANSSSTGDLATFDAIIDGGTYS